MSICDTIIRRMGGRLDVTSALGEGTTVRILVPLEFCELEDTYLPGSPTLPSSISSADVPPPSRKREFSNAMRRRIISDELTSLFNPGQPLASPFEEHSNFDFSRAVSTAQASLVQPGNLKLAQSSSSSHRSRNPTFLGRTGTDDDFVDEMAKLSVGTASSPQPVNHNPPNGDFFSLPPPVASSSTAFPHHASSTLSPREGAAQEGFIPTSPGKRFAEHVRVLIADDNAIGRSILTKLFSGKVSSSRPEFGLSQIVDRSVSFPRVSTLLKPRTVKRHSTSTLPRRVTSISYSLMFRCLFSWVVSRWLRVVKTSANELSYSICTGRYPSESRDPEVREICTPSSLPHRESYCQSVLSWIVLTFDFRFTDRSHWFRRGPPPA